MLRFPATWLLVWLATAAFLRAGPWPVVDSDLPQHPSLHTGTLPNGLRYALLPNAEPKDRVSLRLLVAVGSLHENDDERGLAHFVEHMAFRGTRRHPTGSLTAALQRLGLGLGPDSAAFTSYEHTIYHLELPDTKEATLREGLQVFHGFASEVTFDPPQIERERGVILSEIATRNTPTARSNEYNLGFLWPNSRQARREVGGIPATIRKFTREQFVAFYDAWYRPERLAVIAVGNIDPPALARLIEAELGSLAPRAPARPEPSDLTPAAAHKPDVDVYAEPALVGVALTFEHPVHRPRTRDTHANRVAQLHELLAFAMFHERLQKISHEPGASFVGPVVQLSPALPEWQLATLSVAGKISDWRQVATEVEHEHRRAFLFGFNAAELDAARATFAAGYDQAVRTQPTWPSDWLATRLANCLLSGAAFARAEAMREDLGGALAATTLDDCTNAFRRVWTTAPPHVFIAANPAFAIDRHQIGAMLNESREKAVTERKAAAALVFGYESFGPPGQLARSEHLADLDVRLSEFTNGVWLNFKSTTFEADTVEVQIRVGEGKLTQPVAQPGLDLLANHAVIGGGLGRHTMQEFSTLLAGRSVNLRFGINSDAFVFAVRCPPRDLGLALQIVAAYLTDAAYRPEAIRDAHAAFNTMYASLAVAPSGGISLHALRLLAGGDKRFGVPTADELFARQMTELKTWMEPQFKHGPIELSIVGDTTWEEASAAVGRTLGALGKRDERKAPGRTAANAKPPRATADTKYIAIDPKLPQCAIAWYWPVPTLKTIQEERRCRLLAAVLHDRCRVRLRDELGAAYSPIAGFSETPGFPNQTFFHAYAEVPPARLQQAQLIIQNEAAALASRGVEPDEFTRAHQPFLRERTDNLRTNVYWGGTVLSDAQQNPARLAAARDRTADTAAITAAELSRLAKRYLDPTKALRFATVPLQGFSITPNSAAGANKAAPRP